MGTVSVIVPVGPADEEWLDQCLQSIRSQDYNDIELLVEHDPEGTGPAATRNRALKKVTGKYVMFCDADDYLAPGSIRKMVEAIPEADMVLGGFRKFVNFEQTVSQRGGRWNMRQVAAYVMANLGSPMKNQLLSGCWAKLYRADKVEEFPNLKI